jgi:hypothetical protein
MSMRWSSADSVLDGAIVLARDRHVPAVGEMPASGKPEAHDGVAGVTEREVDGQVRRRAGVGLDVRVVDAEELLYARLREGLDDVDDLLAFVVALVGVALGVLVVEDAAARFHHGGPRVVLAGDEAHLVVLASLFSLHQGSDFGVHAREGVVGHRSSPGPGLGRRHSTEGEGSCTLAPEHEDMRAS